MADLDRKIGSNAALEAKRDGPGEKMKALVAFGIAEEPEGRPRHAGSCRPGAAEGHGQDPRLDPVEIPIERGDRLVLGSEEEALSDERGVQSGGNIN
jgi:hypothetical protein